MKTSNKILLLVILIILFACIIMCISFGIFLFYDNPRLITFGEGSLQTIRKEYSFTGFDSINITGFWEVAIKQADSFSITITAPEYAAEYLQLFESDRTLFIQQLYFTGIPPVSPEISIALPALSGIKTNGNPKISFSGFMIDDLVIETSGYSEIKGSNSRINNLNIIGSGMTTNNLNECSVVNALLDLSGAGTTSLNMDGGILGGRAIGNIVIKVRGSVSEQHIDIFGSAEIVRIDGNG